MPSLLEPDEAFAEYTPEEWGPQSPGDWAELDRLDRELRLRQHDRTLTPTWPSSVFASWLRLPAGLRRQSWREREIAAQLFEFEDLWNSVPGGFHGVGVGIRKIADRPSLVVVLSTTLDPGDYPNFVLGVPGSIKVPSIIPELGESEAVAVVVEKQFRPTLLQGGEIMESPGCPADHQPTLRSGLSIAGEDEWGLLVPGTLSAVVRNAEDQQVLLSAAHVCGSRVVRWAEETQDVIGTPYGSDPHLDVSSLNPTLPYRIDARLPHLDVLPSPPVVPLGGMPVQMFGAESGHQKGYIHASYQFPMTAYRIGFVSWISVNIVATAGDSGALLVSGHDLDSAIELSQARHMSRGYFDSMVCSLLGILRAGPSPDASPTTNPVSYFSPIIQVFDALQVSPETVERREVA